MKRDRFYVIDKDQFPYFDVIYPQKKGLINILGKT